MNYIWIAIGLIVLAVGAMLIPLTPIVATIQIAMGALLVALKIVRIIRQHAPALEGK